ncbi:hypothetical protein [Streptomyces bambusae]|uniref:Uncharacterized protein n=1 Tax=Streptomyces bambusae TaxID=1550616 RepID=A0ABS6ZBH9_9ACTN|nr:hypothetical protein [Streptomyces bambusae]MBW5485122.1 hypothetical protein [Streptomyces bambusae]
METTDDLARLQAAVDAHALVNLTGGLGSGKSVLARRLAVAAVVDLADGFPGEGAGEGRLGVLRRLVAQPGGLLLVDGVDGPGQAAAVAAVLDPARSAVLRPVLLVSRRPLRAVADWGENAPATVGIGPRSAEAIEAQARAAGITDPADLAFVVRLAGGVPLLAELACRALHLGVAPDPGPAADWMAGEVLERLGRERPGQRWRHAVRLLATVRTGDERLLAGGPGLFEALAGLSLVQRERLGLAIREPYRTLFETAYRWRRPQAYEEVRNRAAGYRRALLTERAPAPGPEERAGLVEEGLFLTGDPLVRSTLFPPAEEVSRIGPSRPGEAEDIGRLMHRWAVRGGFDVRRSERIVERWLEGGSAAFRLARDREGRPVGLAALFPVGADTEAGIEPLLQQHTPDLVGGGAHGGLFLGAAYGADPVVHGQILRDVLAQSVRAGHLVVSTASPDYQALLRTLSFRPHGEIRDDVYRCGRRPEVYSHDFGAAGLPGWMGALAPGGAGASGAVAGGGQVRRVAGQDAGVLVAWALARAGDLAALAQSPLLTLPGIGSAVGLRAWLEDTVAELAAAGEPADAEAGAILQAYYFGRARTHHQVARRLHLSRATYFRRLRRGLSRLTSSLPPGEGSRSQDPPCGSLG